MIHIALHASNIASTLHVIARAGGGGSSGGSGGGGVGGVMLAGYFPAYYGASWGRRKLELVGGIILGGLAGVVVTTLFMFGSISLGILVLIGAVIGLFAGLSNFHARLRGTVTKNRKAIQQAAAVDPAWNEQSINNRIQQVFMAYQADWSVFNTPAMQAYLTPRYLQHVYLMMRALADMGRQDNMQNVRLLQSAVIAVHDAADNNQDSFSAYIQAQADDQLVERTTGKVLLRDTEPFEEIWHFVRSGDTWLLDGITQSTADINMLNKTLLDFATQNGMYYSLDWGWLLLPKRGQLFKSAKFKNSDVNNHVIGDWSGLLVQMYTYTPNKNGSSGYYLIGQINLPKTYGGIVIKRRGFWSFLGRAPRGYQRVRLEWPDFNKRYDVYATDMERVTTFELLNPAFMAELYDMDLPINIEVVDNLVYFYSKVSSPNLKYPAMLRVLQRAYKELKR